MNETATGNVTLKDIAEKTNYSLVSVHRAMNGKPGVSERTRQEILAAAHEMGYTANLMASFLKRKQLNIAIVFPEYGRTGSYYYNYMWKGFRTYIEENSGYQINFLEFPFELQTSHEHEELLQLDMLDKVYDEWGDRLDGLLTVPMVNTAVLSESIARFTKKNVQVVLIDNDLPDCGRLCCIAPNDENTGRLGAELMCSMIHQTSGTILVAAGNSSSLSHRMNAMGFADYVRTHRPELNVVVVNDTQNNPQSQTFYDRMLDPAIIAAYSVRARNTIPLCNAALRLESQRKLLLLGSDLFKESAEMLRRGVLKGIIYKNPYQKGYQGIKTLVERLIREKTPRSDSLSVQISVILRNNLVFFEEFI